MYSRKTFDSHTRHCWIWIQKQSDVHPSLGACSKEVQSKRRQRAPEEPHSSQDHLGFYYLTTLVLRSLAVAKEILFGDVESLEEHPVLAGKTGEARLR